MLKRFSWWFLNSWKPAALWLIVISLLVVCFGWQLDGLKGQFSQLEINYLDSAASLKQVLKNPEFLPHKLLALTANKLNFHPDITLRLPSAIIASISVITGLVFFRKQFSFRISILAGILLISSSWLASLGRLALPDVSYMLWLPLLAAWYWLRSTNKQKLALLIFTLAAGLALYIPSFIFLMLIFWYWRKRAGQDDKLYISSWYKLLCGFIFLVTLAPLAYSLVIQPSQLLIMMGLPFAVPLFSVVANQAFNQVAGIFLINNSGPIYTVGRLPLVDVFALVFMILGIYTLRYSDRQNASFWAAVAGSWIVLICLGGLVTNAIFLPVIYFLAACGLRFLLEQWFTVFPRNPIARAVGTALLSLGVILTAFYHLNRYFIVWANAPATRQTFNHSLLE